MFFFVSLALVNGVLIGLGRTINGNLGLSIGAVRASLWNHVVGFVFLSMLIAVRDGIRIDIGSLPPFYAWLGGPLGVVFVAVNSHVVPRLGASRTAALVVGAQMVTGVVIDSFASQFSAANLLQLGGSAAIIAGVAHLRRSSSEKTPADSATDQER